MLEPIFRKMIERLIDFHEQTGEIKPIQIPELPDWDGKSIKKLKEEGKIQLKIDNKMPQALATSKLYEMTETLASSDITILRIRGNNGFLTSDFPSITLDHFENKYAQRFIPLAPKVGLIFHTHTYDPKRKNMYTYTRTIGKKQVAEINNKIIKAAEELIFSARKYPWLTELIRELKDFHTEMVTENIGPYTISQEQTKKKTN